MARFSINPGLHLVPSGKHSQSAAECDLHLLKKEERKMPATEIQTVQSVDPLQLLSALDCVSLCACYESLLSLLSLLHVLLLPL